MIFGTNEKKLTLNIREINDTFFYGRLSVHLEDTFISKAIKAMAKNTKGSLYEFSFLINWDNEDAICEKSYTVFAGKLNLSPPKKVELNWMAVDYEGTSSEVGHSCLSLTNEKYGMNFVNCIDKVPFITDASVVRI